jgi:MerR family mercuric resistance operon transcriptional regulator
MGFMWRLSGEPRSRIAGPFARILLKPYYGTRWRLAEADMSARLLSSGELAREAGVNVETLRYYERRGLLTRPMRTPNGHRRYDAEAVSILRLIKQAQDLGFTLAEITELLRGLERPGAVCDDVCRAIDARVGQVDAELARLRAQRSRLSRLRASCPRSRPLRECPVVVELKGVTPKGRRQ